jgi:hypothetical protein
LKGLTNGLGDELSLQKNRRTLTVKLHTELAEQKHLLDKYTE